MLGVHCPTCLDPLAPEDDLRCPPCGHVFHHTCLRTWLDNKRASGGTPDCPQCRKVTDTGSLMKIYLAAEADIDQEENQESAELQCKLDEKLAEIEILRKYLTEFKVKNEQLLNTELRCQAEINFIKSKLQRSENETFKLRNKWFKERRMLQELEVKQGVLKKELGDVKRLLEDTDKKRKEAVGKISSLKRKLFEFEYRQQLDDSEKINNLGFDDRKIEDDTFIKNSVLSAKHNNSLTKYDTETFSLDHLWQIFCSQYSASLAIVMLPVFAFSLIIYAFFCPFLPFFPSISLDFAFCVAGFCFLLSSIHGHCSRGGLGTTETNHHHSLVLENKKTKSMFKIKKEKRKKTSFHYLYSFCRNLTLEEMKNTLIHDCIGSYTDVNYNKDKLVSFFDKTIKRAALCCLIFLLYTLCCYVFMFIKFGFYVSRRHAALFVIETGKYSWWVGLLTLFLV